MDAFNTLGVAFFKSLKSFETFCIFAKINKHFNNMRKEIWKPVEGYEKLYEISNLGRVKSLKYGKERILKPEKDKYGYLRVQLWRDGKYKMFLAHRLVAIAFIPNPKGFEQVNHLDEVKTNNCAENLEFCDAKYNSNYGTRTKRQAAARSKAVETSKYEDFREICLRFSSTSEAGRNGYNQSAVAACCRGCFNYEGNNKYKNLYWRYTS